MPKRETSTTKRGSPREPVTAWVEAIRAARRNFEFGCPDAVPRLLNSAWYVHAPSIEEISL